MSVNNVNGIATPRSPNAIINGAFDIWQRATSFTATGYSADRWWFSVGGTTTGSRNTDVPTGIGAQYSFNWTTGASSSFGQFYQALESAEVVPMRNKLVTFSFYIKTAGSMAGNLDVNINYSNSTDALLSQSTAVSIITGNASLAASSVTNWTRTSVTFIVPSDAVGLRVAILPSVAQVSGVSCRITGVQLEEGSVATPFRRSANSIEGELSSCQRYYWRFDSLGASGGFMPFAMAHGIDSNNCRGIIMYPVRMRRIPSIAFSSASTFTKSFGNPMTSVVGAEIGFDSASVQWGRSG